MKEEPSVKFTNNEQVARAVYWFIKNDHPQYRLRPFNRFDTAYTDWWIVPSGEWPAYKFSKLCFRRHPRSPEGKLFIGLYVEKGLGQRLHGFPGVRTTHILKRDWYWNKFVSEAVNGQVEKIARKVCKKAQLPVRILVEAYAFNRVSKPDGTANKPEDWIEFVIEFQSFQWALARPAQNILSDFNESQRIDDLVQKIHSSKDLEFYWVDCTIGVSFRYSQGVLQGWNEVEIWEKVLQGWTVFGLNNLIS